MQKYFLAVLFCFQFVSKSYSQCPTAGFTFPSSICIGSSFDAINTTVNGVTYEWDFCAGDLAQIPVGAPPISTLNLFSPVGIELAFDGTNWYGFVCNFGSNTITRVDFGNSLNNTPLAFTALNILGASVADCYGIEIIKDGNYWYALVNRVLGSRIIRLDLDSLNNNSPNAVDLNVTGLNIPYNGTVVKDGNNFRYLVANNSGNSVTVVDFGATLANNAPLSSNFPAAGAGGPQTIDVAKDCDTWYGFIPFGTNGIVMRVNFGSSLTNAPVVIDTVTNIVYSGVRELEVINENNNWYVFILDGSGSDIGRLDFGQNLSNQTPVFNPFGNLGMLSGCFAFTLEKEGSEYYGFATQFSAPNNIIKFAFPNNCSANISTSGLENPAGIIYSSFGTYNISLTATDSTGNTDYISDSIQIANFPTAGFTFTSACINQPALFTDTSSALPGLITGWIWDFGDGDSSNLQNPTHIYTNDSTYYVTLTVTSDAGCTATIGDSVTISDLPQADFSFIDNQCAFADVFFNDLSIPPAGDSIVLWVWNYGDGSPQDSVQNPIHAFDTTGTFTVLLTVYSGAGCFDTLSQSINILPGPLADFTFSETCVGETVQFNNISFIPGGGTLDFDWDFGDLTTSTATNPSHQYISIPADYPVKLVATSVNFCVDSVIKNIHISTKPNPGFNFSPVNACVGYSVNFNSASTIATGDTIDLQSWDFGDLSPIVTGSSVSHIYNTAGTYSIVLTVNALSACDTIITQTITVTQCPPTNCPVVAFDIADSVCANTPLILTNNSYAGSTYEWDFCAGDLAQAPIGQLPIPTSTLSSPVGIELAYDGTNWYGFVCNFGSNTITRVGFGNSLNNPPISFTVLTILGASITDCYGIEIIKDGNYWYALVNRVISNRIIRLDLDSLNNDTVNAVDLNVSGLNNPYNGTVTKDGNNFVYLIANNAGDSITVVDFGISLDNNTPAATNFPAAGSAGPQTIDVAKDCDTWYGFIPFGTDGVIMRVNFGNSLTNIPVLIDTLAIISYPGVRELEVINENNKWYAFILDGGGNDIGRLEIGESLGSNTTIFTALGSLGVLSGSFEFTLEREGSKYYGFATQYLGPNNINKFVFPDLCSANTPISTSYNPSNISYSQTGLNYISLYSTDNDGNTGFYSDSVFVKPGPLADFSYSPACLNNSIYFSDLTSFPQGTITSWLWDFGDTGTSPQQNSVYVFNNTGNYNVTLTATGSNGCSNSFSQSIEVKDNPVANFSFPASLCSETPVLFSDLSTFQAPDSLITWDWNFNDGSSNSNVQNPTHVFDTGGVYNIKLVVTAITGCSDTIVQSVTINSSAEADFTVSQTCIGEVTQFTNNTTGGVANSYTWYFGDGGSVTSLNASHLYAQGTYTAQLQAISSNGCNDTIDKEIRIGGKAIAGFSFAPITACEGNTIQFIDTSFTMNSDSIILSTWNFGDSLINETGDTVNHVYANSGTYTVTLTVTTYTACDTVITAIVDVLESPVAGFSFANVCLDSAMTFLDTSTTPAGTILNNLVWIFGDGDTIIGPPQTSQTHLYAAAGTYTVTLYVENNSGCNDTMQQVVEVYANPDAEFFVPGIPCASSPVLFIDDSTPALSITSFFWNFGDAGTSSLQFPEHIYQSGGPFNVSLTVTTNNGCVNTEVIPVTINHTPVFDFTYSNTCFGNDVQFTYVPDINNPVPAVGWDWDFGDNLTSSIQNPPPHTYTTIDSFVVTLVATASNTCAGVDSQTIYVNPTPQASFNTDNNICLEDTSFFFNTTTISGGIIQQWQWSFGDSNSDNSQDPTHIYGNAGNYLVQLIAISDSGCADTAVVQVFVSPLPLINYVLSTNYGSPPLNITIQNTTPGSNNFTWNFGDGTGTIPGNAPPHTYFDTGSYIVTAIATNNFGCTDSLKQTVDVVIPYLDLAVLSIAAVQQNNLLAISAEIKNTGNVFANNFEINARTEFNSTINELWNELPPFAPGDVMTYNFNARYEIDPTNIPDYFCVEILKVNNTIDAVLSNNRMCASLISEFELFDIHPNPASEEVVVSSNFPFEGIIDLCIYNTIGQLVYCEKNIEVKKGYNEFTVGISHIAKEIYACTVLYNGNLKTKKFIKK